MDSSRSSSQSREAATGNGDLQEIEMGAFTSLTKLIRGRCEWQKGYSAFSVSFSNIQSVQRYVRNQAEHHRKKSFQEEYIEFLKRHRIEFDPRYLFEGEHVR